MHVFVSCSYWIVLAKIFGTILSKNIDSVHPCLVPKLRENAFSFSPFNMMLAVSLSYSAFIFLRYGSSINNLFTVLICVQLCECFFCIYWNDRLSFISHFLDMLYYIYGVVNYWLLSKKLHHFLGKNKRCCRANDAEFLLFDLLWVPKPIGALSKLTLYYLEVISGSF